MNEFKQPVLGIEEALKVLKNGVIEIPHGLLPWGSNYTLLVTVKHEGQEHLAVYKPASGERPLWDFPDGTLSKREVAAFFLDRVLGWSIVPATVLRSGPHGLGSLQYFIPHDPDYHYFNFEGKHTQQTRHIALFDIVINNADRKAGHCIVDGDSHVWGIDHGICFHYEPKLRTVIWEYAGQSLTSDERVGLEKLCEKLADAPLNSELARLLSKREIEAISERLGILLENGVFPEPGTGRSYPWPPV